MSEPITRTVNIQQPHGSWKTNVKEVSVPWCETHDSPFVLPGPCLYVALSANRSRPCKLLDPHVPTAVWRGTDG